MTKRKEFMFSDSKKMKIAFVVWQFPTVSETFIINQVADLVDRGVDVEIFSLKGGVKENIAERYYQYKNKVVTHYLDMPANFLVRFLQAWPRIGKLMIYNPLFLFKALNFIKYGRNAWSLKLIFWCAPFLGKKFDLVHCHYGTVANKYLIIKDILGLPYKFITTFYGIDISHYTKVKPVSYYDKLKKECSLYLAMSENMKARVVAQGFPEDKIRILPISIDVASYPFKERKFETGSQVEMVAVGRFVAKKGFDDLLRALAIVKAKTDKPFRCTIIGDGPLKNELYNLTDELELRKIVDYKGYMKLEDVINQFLKSHLCLQPSKTAADGDME